MLADLTSYANEAGPLLMKELLQQSPPLQRKDSAIYRETSEASEPKEEVKDDKNGGEDENVFKGISKKFEILAWMARAVFDTQRPRAVSTQPSSFENVNQTLMDFINNFNEKIENEDDENDSCLKCNGVVLFHVSQSLNNVFWAV